MKETPIAEAVRKVLTVRASSLADLFDCAYRWEARHILRMRSPASLRMILGTAVHAGTAAFDSARMAGKPIKPNDAAGALVDKLRDPGEDVRIDDDDISAREAEVIGLNLHSKYCTLISPRYDFRAVELDLGSLDIDVPEQGVTVRVTGHLDRSRVVRSSTVPPAPGAERTINRIADIKTGGRAAFKDGRADIRGKGLQLGVYQILAERKMREPVDEQGEIIGLCTSAGAATGVSTIHAPKRQVLGDANTPSLIHIAANMLKSGYFPPNPASITCGPKYCPRWSSCPYHE